MPYFTTCQSCPYYKGKHLNLLINNLLLSIDIGLNSLGVLLVFQAPGIEEWKTKLPLQPTIKKGGTA